MGRLVVLAAALLALPAHAGPSAWTRTAVAAHPVSVEVPEVTERQRDVSDWVLGRAETDSLRAEVDGARLSVSVTVAPLTALRIAGPSLVFTTTRSTILDKAKGRMVSWTDVHREGLDGKRLVYEAPDPAGGRRRGTMEVFLKDQYIVTLDAQVPTGVGGDHVERFLGSVRMFADPR